MFITIFIPVKNLHISEQFIDLTYMNQPKARRYRSQLLDMTYMSSRKTFRGCLLKPQKFGQVDVNVQADFTVSVHRNVTIHVFTAGIGKSVA